MTAERIEVRNLSVNFGGVLAVDGVDLDVAAGRLTGLIGPNGAGKTTLFDAISGLVPHTGQVLLGGRDLSGLPPEARARAGIGRSFQDARLFPGLSVRETLAFAIQRRLQDPGAAAEVLGWPQARASERAIGGRVDELVSLFGLDAYADKFLSELSTGTRRIVDLACVYAREPSVILLDEPSSGIAQREVEALGEVILRLRELAGATILIVEHDIPLIRQISEDLVVMEAGAVLAEGAPDDVLERPEVITSYLGSDRRALERSGTASGSELVPVVAAAAAAAEGPPPGLPEKDDFKIPTRPVAGTAVAALAALLVTPFLFIPPPAHQQVVANRNVTPAATPSPVPAPLPSVPLPALQPPAPPGFPPVDVFVPPFVLPGASSPSPSPSPAPVVPCADQFTPIPEPLASALPGVFPSPLVSAPPCPLPSPASPSPTPTPT